MKKLPHIAIEGVGNTPEEKLQSLVEIETVLVLAGYELPDEKWNNISVSCGGATHILAGDGRQLGYYNHDGEGCGRHLDSPKVFRADQLPAILKFITP
jgi:hypothetical protein